MNTISTKNTDRIFIRCANGGIHNCSPDWSWNVERMSDYDIWLVCGGIGQLQSAGKIYQISAGDCFVIPIGAKVFATHNPNHPLKVISSHFDFVDEGGNTALPAEKIAFHTKLSSFALIEMLMNRCVGKYLAGEKQQASFWLQAALLEYINAQLSSKTVNENDHNAKINLICEKIAQNPHLTYRVSDLASNLHICPDHFNRLFKKKTGVSTIEFITNCRIENAKNLLISSSYPISRIAELCGYNSVYYFSKHFRKNTGTSPSRFRALALGGVGKSKL